MKQTLQIDSGSHRDLERLFGGGIITELALTGRSNALLGILRETNLHCALPREATLSTLFQSLFDSFLSEYRCEFVYKTALATKVFLARHTFRTASIIPEFRAGASIADFVVLNGTSVVYEIKTDYDNLDRLSSQLDDYKRCFDQVFVVTSPRWAEPVLQVLGEDVGLIILTDRYTLQIKRQSHSHRTVVDPATIMDSLRQPEYKAIVGNVYGEVPRVANGFIYQACRERFLQMEPAVAHDEMVRVLKRTRAIRMSEDLFRQIPVALKFAVLQARLQPQAQQQLISTLSMPLESVMS